MSHPLAIGADPATAPTPFYRVTVPGTNVPLSVVLLCAAGGAYFYYTLVKPKKGVSYSKKYRDRISKR